jgi:DNA replication protein DnaC
MEEMSMFETIDELTDKISANVPHADSEYIGEDGLLHCSVCHKNTQTEVTFLGIKKVVRCICDCKANELKAFEERKKQEDHERKRRRCFAETNMASWTFANDDRSNPKLSDAMQNYVKNFTEFRQDGKGLLLHGTVGTGKTYFAACVANALIDKGYSVLMTNFSSLTNQIQGTFDGKQEFINSLNDYSLLIIDDLGAERKSEYMQEMVFNIIDSRYRSGLPFIITTNLTTDEIKKPQEIGYSRIYDRILERCFPVEVSGKSRRRQNVKDTFFDVKEKLGL